MSDDAIQRRAFLSRTLTGAALMLSASAHSASSPARPSKSKSTPKPKPASRQPAPQTKPRPERPLHYAANVRTVTRRLSIPRGRWRFIVLHHSGLSSGNAAAYDRAHRRRGMENGLAYHFVIGNGVDSKDGGIEIGSRWLRQIQGGHVRSAELNEVAIGICLVGNFEWTRPTPRQVAATIELIGYLRDVLGPRVRIVTHTEAHPGHTRCPGRHFPMQRLRTLYG